VFALGHDALGCRAPPLLVFRRRLLVKLSPPDPLTSLGEARLGHVPDRARGSSCGRSGSCVGTLATRSKMSRRAVGGHQLGRPRRGRPADANNQPGHRTNQRGGHDQPRFICARCPRIAGRLLCPAMVAEMGQLDEASDGRADGAVPPCKPSRAVGSDGLPDSRSEGRVSRGLVGS